MNNKEAQRKLAELEAKVAELKKEISRGEIDIFEQPDVMYEVWNGERPPTPSIMRFHNIDEGQDYFKTTAGFSLYRGDHHRLITPQWIKIPDEMMEAPDIKGLFLIKTQSGATILRSNPGIVAWDHEPTANSRTTEVCILEPQD